jgi:hypothetical protein
MESTGGLAQAAIASCGKVADQYAAIGMTPQSIAQAKPLIERTRAAAIVELDHMRLMPEAASAVKKVMSTIQFRMPQTGEERVRDLKSTLEYQLTKIAVSIKTATSATPEDLLVLLVSNAILKNDETATGLICTYEAPEEVSDFALTDLGEINVSWQTLRFPRYGYGIVAHEMGHIISSVIAEQNKDRAPYDLVAYNSMKACTADRHGGVENRTATDEEDFADLFSAQVAKRLVAQDLKLANMGCLLISQDGNRYGTRDGLTLWNDKGDGDVHSAHFFRVVQQEIDLGHKLTPSCQKVVDQGLPSMNRACY